MADRDTLYDRGGNVVGIAVEIDGATMMAPLVPVPEGASADNRPADPDNE